jgi:ribonuclease HII
MKHYTISVIKQMFENNEITEDILKNLRLDERKGVQSLIHQYERKKESERQQVLKYKEMQFFEEKLKTKGKHVIAGVDEAGRGPLAGPVVAASVILPDDFQLLGLNDSKQLKAKEREAFFAIIKDRALAYHISVISNEQIDQLNILEATKLAMKEAIEGLSIPPEHVLVDAGAVPDITIPFNSIIKGDEKSVTIAAASILAKVTRDHLMKEIHNYYPMYGFDKNMGYGTKQHMDGLKRYGATSYHRKSFAPVRKIIG